MQNSIDEMGLNVERKRLVKNSPDGSIAPFLEFKFPSEEQPRIYQTLSDAEEIIKNYVDRYSWIIHSKNGQSRRFGNSTPRIIELISRLRNISKSDKEDSNRLKQIFRETFGSGILPVPGSPLDEFFVKLKEKDENAALNAILSYSDFNGINYNSSAARRGLFALEAFRTGLSVYSAESSRKSLAGLSGSYRRSLNILEADTVKIINKSEDDIENVIKRLRRTGIVAAKLLRRFRVEEKERSDLIASELQSTKEAYQEFMKLQAPVEYWREKEKEHRESASTYLIVMLLALIVVGISLLIGLNIINAQAAGLLKSNSPFTAYLVLVAQIVVGTLGLFWIVGFVSRLYMSEHHLKIDAGERAVMVQTYLALTKEAAADEADRSIVLAALFRPTADGIVKEDKGPNLEPFLAALSRARGQGGSSSS